MTALALLGAAGCRSEPRPVAATTTHERPDSPSGLVSAALRDAALRSAQVWMPTAIERADLRSNPPGEDSFQESDVVECRLVKKAMDGTTPKFDCELATGEVVRIKYGRGNPEIHAEVAATRLLAALGFGADRMYVVKRVRCAGCTPFPFHSLRCFGETGLERPCFPKGLDYSSIVDFDHVVIERRLAGRRIEATADQGWAWYELDRIDPAAGGAPRAHVDALRLMAMLIGHWDNKAENQRLICLPGGDRPDGGCSRPLAIVQDLGASFGPLKLDLHNWRSTKVWSDPRLCRVSMLALPWGGGTFGEQQISEAGRRFLLERLERLSTAQVQDMFAGARIELLESVTADGRLPEAWAAALLDKVQQIRAAGPCPVPGQDPPTPS